MKQDKNFGKGFHTNAICFQTTAFDLQQIAQDIQNQSNAAPATMNKMAIYRRTVPVIAGLATECALKALSAKSTGTYLPIHNLVKLYEVLNDNVKRIVGSIAASQGVSSPLTILEIHRMNFVDWRYPPPDDGRIMSFYPTDLFKVLGILMTTWNHQDFLKLCLLVESKM